MDHHCDYCKRPLGLTYRLNIETDARMCLRCWTRLRDENVRLREEGSKMEVTFLTQREGAALEALFDDRKEP